LWSLIHTVPVRSRGDRASRARDRVHTLAANPYSLWLARATASASSSNRSMTTSGPKISSC
jgi:hypothetical protein